MYYGRDIKFSKKLCYLLKKHFLIHKGCKMMIVKHTGFTSYAVFDSFSNLLCSVLSKYPHTKST